MKYYYLLGNHIDYSLSPEIHNLFFEQNQIDAKYQLLDAKDDFENAIERLKSEDVSGFNVTIPYKTKIIPYLDQMSDKARAIGSVNTVDVTDGKWVGYNTDVDGFVQSMAFENICLDRKRILLLGAGSAAHSIAYVIIKKGVKSILIYNRSHERRNAIWTDITNDYGFKNVMGIHDYHGVVVDIVINTTPIGGVHSINEQIVDLSQFTVNHVIDLIYNPKKTALLKQAETLDIKTVNGLGMLINQALYAEQIWQKKRINPLHLKEMYYEYQKRLFND